MSSPTSKHGYPQAQGLYLPEFEHENCGFGFIAQIKNKPSHEVVEKGLEILENLEHRGAVGADPLMGDGAGILVQTPHAFMAKVMPFALPEKHAYAVAMIFYPNDTALRDRCAEAGHGCGVGTQDAWTGHRQGSGSPEGGCEGREPPEG